MAQLETIGLVLRLREPEGLHQRRRHIWNVFDGLPFLGGQRRHIVVKAVHGHAPLVVLHRRQEFRQRQRRIGRPVAVIPAVKVPHRSVDGDDGAHDAARAEEQRRAAAGMPRTIHHDERVASNPAAVLTHDRLERWRARFFIPFEHDPNVRGERDVGVFESIDGREEGDDR